MRQMPDTGGGGGGGGDGRRPVDLIADAALELAEQARRAQRRVVLTQTCLIGAFATLAVVHAPGIFAALSGALGSAYLVLPVLPLAALALLARRPVFDAGDLERRGKARDIMTTAGLPYLDPEGLAPVDPREEASR